MKMGLIFSSGGLGVILKEKNKENDQGRPINQEIYSISHYVYYNFCEQGITMKNVKIVQEEQQIGNFCLSHSVHTMILEYILYYYIHQRYKKLNTAAVRSVLFCTKQLASHIFCSSFIVSNSLILQSLHSDFQFANIHRSFLFRFLQRNCSLFDLQIRSYRSILFNCILHNIWKKTNLGYTCVCIFEFHTCSIMLNN